ncbi:MAG: PfkB family carbohydrate kinase [Thermoguttaceae bacterium]
MLQNTSFDVLGLGAVAVDEILYVDEYPPAESKVRVRERVRQCGGLTGTALVAAARQGARCAYAGLLGDDELSLFVIDAMAREGIDFRHAVRRSDARPAHSTIIVDRSHGTRTIFASLGGVLGPDRELPSADVIRSARVLLVDHHGVEGTLRAVRIARESEVSVVADFERDPGPPFGALLAAVDHLIVSERFARQWTGRADAAAAVESLWHADRRAVVVTCGSQGCWYRNRQTAAGAESLPLGATVHVPAFPVEVVDTTGCGDVFHGAYAAALAAGATVARCVALASASAALKATSRGGQAGVPRREPVEEFLKRTGGRVIRGPCEPPRPRPESDRSP